MLTFTALHHSAQQISGDESAGTLIMFKRWINEASHIMRARLGRYWNRESATANLVADQQYYQTPENCLRVTGVVGIVDDARYPLEEVYNEERWNVLNTREVTSEIPAAFFIRGDDEIGIYPIPASAVTGGLEIYFEPREKNMSQDDYTTGTVTVTNGSATITGSGTTFTQAMVGRYFRVTDGSEGLWYRIATFTSTTVLVLENIYEGTSGAAKTYEIGEMANLPDELHEALIDYAMYRYSLRRRDPASTRDYRALWESAIDMARQNYARKTTSRVITRQRFRSSDYGFGQLPTDITG